MKRYLFLLLLTCSAFAQQNCPEYVQIQNNAAYNREQLKSVLASKADLSGAVQTLTAAIAAIPACTSPGPVPSASPSLPGSGGIFIGTTEYQHLADAGAAYKPGDTISIKKSQDNESAALVNGDVNVVCDPNVKLTWSAGVGSRIAWGKGIFDIEGQTKHFMISGCEISGSVLDPNQGGNGAAVRIIDGVDLAVFTNVNFHDNNNGILGAAKSTIISNSKFYNNGAGPGQDGHTHNVYFSAYADQVTVTNSYFGPVTQGNLFKSRAKATSITGCQFESKSGTDSSYIIDIPNGGLASVQKSVILKASGQSQRFILSYGVEGLTADGRTNSYDFGGNIVVSDMNGAFMNGTGSFNFHDNKMVGSFDNLVNQTNSQTFADRASAGLSPAPALPAVP